MVPTRVVLALERLKREESHEFPASLVYIVLSRPAWATETVSK